jgi:diguanylate cyclase (GGDEF)-like protein
MIYKNKKEVYENLKKKLTELRKLEKHKEKIDYIDKAVNMFYDLAIKDQKTNLYVFRFFEELYKIETEKARREREELCLLIIDIDDFKKINLDYGYLKADKILFEFAQTITKTIRKSDIAARFGGEEFVILLPFTTINKAKFFVKRLKNNLSKNRIIATYKVKASIGIVSFKEGDTTKSLFKKANLALKHAKETGKDKVVVYKE